MSRTIHTPHPTPNTLSSHSPSSRTQSHLAYTRLHEEIVACGFPPGIRLTEAEVVAWLEVGKTPAREALRRLVQEGLVLVEPRRGYRVAPVTLRDVDEVCGVRLVVEPAAAALAADRATPEELTAIEAVSHTGYDAGDAESTRAFHQANTAFHLRIAQASGNRRLAELVARLLAESRRLIQFGMLLHPQSDDAVHRHEALLAALRARDPEAARRAAEAEIDATREMVRESLLRSPAVREAEA